MKNREDYQNLKEKMKEIKKLKKIKKKPYENEIFRKSLKNIVKMLKFKKKLKITKK